ncbi:carbohydrate ABC transporter permease [Micromonospora sp. NBS 11-29]|uniref:carbohydrate ABC transporter permease n=1 Tax=Micromonospora sp. NBS 11-29 TaxID=1960879 RepID=UPI000B76E34B|nr:carbohydrate ABC transporter permease [Micromonospora sp. NBS 11-29]
MRAAGWGRRTVLFVWVLFALFPVYWTFITAFKQQVDIYDGPRFIPFVDFQPTTQAWRTLFGDGGGDFFDKFANSIIFSGVSSLLAVILGGFAAYGLARHSYKYGPYRNDDLSFLIVSQRIMPPIVSVLALYVVFVNLRLLDSSFGMILAYTAMNLPLTVYLLRTFFEAIPVEVEHAAALDGYPQWQRLARVVFPLAAPGLAAAFLLSFFFAWNDFLFSLMLTFNDAQTLPLYITSLNAQSQPLWWLISAVGLVALVPPAIVTVVLDRFMARQVLIGGMR